MIRDGMEIVYQGDQTGVRKHWGSAAFVFQPGKPTMVPDELANHLLQGCDFVLASHVGLTLDHRFPSSSKVLLRRRGDDVSDLIQLRAAARALYGRRPDLSLGIRCSPALAGLVAFDPLWRAGMWLTGGIKPEGMEFDGLVSLDDVKGGHGAVDRFAEKLAEGLEVDPLDWIIPAPETVTVAAEASIKGARLDADGRHPGGLVAIQLTLPDVSRCLPLEHAIVALTALSQDHSLLIIDQDLPDSIGPRVARLGPGALMGIELLRRCDLAIVYDSEAAYMAAAAGTPTLLLADDVPLLGGVPRATASLKDLSAMNAQACASRIVLASREMRCRSAKPPSSPSSTPRLTPLETPTTPTPASSSGSPTPPEKSSADAAKPPRSPKTSRSSTVSSPTTSPPAA